MFRPNANFFSVAHLHTKSTYRSKLIQISCNHGQNMHWCKFKIFQLEQNLFYILHFQSLKFSCKLWMLQMPVTIINEGSQSFDSASLLLLGQLSLTAWCHKIKHELTTNSWSFRIHQVTSGVRGRVRVTDTPLNFYLIFNSV